MTADFGRKNSARVESASAVAATPGVACPFPAKSRTLTIAGREESSPATEEWQHESCEVMPARSHESPMAAQSEGLMHANSPITEAYGAAAPASSASTRSRTGFAPFLIRVNQLTPAGTRTQESSARWLLPRFALR